MGVLGRLEIANVRRARAGKRSRLGLRLLGAGEAAQGISGHLSKHLSLSDLRLI